MHGTAKQRRFGRSLFTSAECWNQPEEAESLSHCCLAGASSTGWSGQQGVALWQSNLPARPVLSWTNLQVRGKSTAAWSRPPGPGHSCIRE
jgi:hypothetical protein